MKLIDVCELIVDCPHSTAKDEGQGIPLVRTPNIGKGRLELSGVHRVSEAVYNQRIERAVPKAGDLILAREAPVGNVALIMPGQKVCLGQRVVLIRPDKEKADAAYLTYYLLSEEVQHRLKNSANGAVVAHLNMNEIRNLVIDLPEISIQKRIATILSSFDDKIALNNRINHNLEEQAQALYKSWFADFEPFKDGKFVKSELGMIPDGWSIQPFLSIAKLCSGGTPKTDRNEFWNGSIPFFTPKDIGSSTFCLSTEKKITEEGLSNCSSALYKAFTTFITARGTVGKICMAGTPMAMNQTNYAICPISYIDDVVLFLITKQLVNNLKNKANGAVFDAITTRDFNGEMVLVAPHEIMDAFSAIVHPIYECILQNEMNNASLSFLRDTLLPKIMSGSLVFHEINSYL